MSNNVDNRPQVPNLGFGRPRSASDPGSAPGPAPASEPPVARARTPSSASVPAVTAHSLDVFKPISFIMTFTFLSPLIIVVSLVGMSFLFQNFKGFIYLGFLIAACLVRSFLFQSNANYTHTGLPQQCDTIHYTNVGNNTFSIFVMTFTLFYLCFPMFVNNSINWWLVASLLFYMVLDGGVKWYTGCLVNNFQIMMDILLGFTLGALIVSSMYFGGSGKYLFFNEVSTDKEVCSVSKNNTFKCSVYKNGELLGTM